MYPAHFPAAERVVLHLGGSPGAVTKSLNLDCALLKVSAVSVSRVS